VKRLAALLAAVLLVVLAVYVRGRLDDDGSSDGGGGGSGGTATLVCVSELDAVCRELDRRHDDLTVRIEDEATTQATLVSPSFDVENPPFDAWLTLQPFPELVAEQRARALQSPALDDTSESLARSPLVIAIWNDRRAALEASCSDGLDWRCIGDVAGRPWATVGGSEAWGTVKPSHPLPDLTGSGLLVISQATASFFQSSEFASNDFSQPGYRPWFEQLERSIPSFPQPPRTPLDEMLSKGPSVFDLAGSLEAAAGPAIARSRDKDRLSILYPSPAATADLVVAPIINASQGGRVTRLLRSDDTAEVLAAAGWRVDGQPLADGLDQNVALPDGSGIPRAGVLEALRQLWIETIR
jgi:hypothetical protein